MEQWWLLNLLVGLGLSQTVIVHWSLPDPGPLPWLVRTIAGGLGAVIGAALVNASSNPMPGHAIWAGLSGAAILIGVANTFVRMGPKR